MSALWVALLLVGATALGFGAGFLWGIIYVTR